MTLLLGFRHLTLPVTITGHLKKNPADTFAYTNGIIVFVKGGNKVLAKAVTDNKGDFIITFTPKKEKSFDFYCTGLGIDTILISSVTVFESDTPEMTFYIPGIRKKTTLGKTICPKCKRADKVYKIVYSDGIPDHFDDDKTANKQNSNPKIIDGEYYAGTCIVGIAKYYCDRDKVEF
ncbi:MAG: hypothetical protein IT249_15590 [Chitinophagaceae bacterium]|nr:hypothetical protein [Chitinophagaceae bacterium]